MKLNKEDYVAKISNATPLQLVIITYELILENISQAKSGGDIADAEHHAYRSHQLLLTLIGALDMSIPISKNLMSLYIYINKLLLNAKLYFSYGKPLKATPYLDEAAEILGILMESWEKAEKSGDNGQEKVMENAQQLFAGLTYRNGKLEEYVDTSNNRGYKA